MTSDPLALDAETMRQMGYETVDLLVGLLADPRGGPALRRATRSEMEARLRRPPPEEGTPFGEVLDEVATDVLPFASRADHPGYFAFIPACGTWPGALGDLVASAANIFAGSWMESAGPSQAELVVLDWFKGWIGYPSAAAGILTSGGSAANMTAMACAREALLGPMSTEAVAYCSDQAHSSVARAARVLGFRPEQVRVLPTDERLRMRPDALAGAMAADRRAGRRPLFVSASAGSTNTGAVDPLPELAALCADAGVWFHVDAAYGGFAALTERGKALLAGIELADSVTLDPHKWLYQPFECGSLLVRDGRRLQAAFEITPDYLRDATVADGEVNFADYGVQLSRSARSLKLWLSLRTFGVAAFRAAIDRSLDLAQLAARRIQAHPHLELLLPPTLGVVCFRRRFDGDRDDEEHLAVLNAALVADYADSGRGLVSSTRLHGRYAIRLCVLNHTSGPDDVEDVLAWLAGHPVAADARSPVLDAGRNTDLADTWLVDRPDEVATLGALPLFAGLPDADLRRIAAAGVERSFEPGRVIVERWDGARDFFILLDGTVTVTIDSRTVRSLGPGDFFGELAALDWGAGYGSVRTATVTASTPARLFVLSSQALNALASAVPAIGDTLRRTARDRLSLS